MAKDLSKLANLPGGTLLVELQKRATDKRQTLHQMAEELGVSYGYIQHLKSGVKAIPKISDEFTGACARYLGLPRIYVLMMAEKVLPGDFHPENEEGDEDAESARRNALSLVAGSHYAKELELSLEELEQAPEKCQSLIIYLYEAVTGLAQVSRRPLPPSKPAP